MDRDDFEQFRPFYSQIKEAVDHAFKRYEEFDDLVLELSEYPSARAHLRSILAANQFERLTYGDERVTSHLFNNQKKYFTVRGSGGKYQNLQFKKVDAKGRTNNIPTKRVQETVFQECFFPEDSEGFANVLRANPVISNQHTITCGYVENKTGTGYEQVLLSDQAKNPPLILDLTTLETNHTVPLFQHNDEERTPDLEISKNATKGTKEDGKQEEGGRASI